jgi:hypothetical protein
MKEFLSMIETIATVLPLVVIPAGTLLSAVGFGTSTKDRAAKRTASRAKSTPIV